MYVASVKSSFNVVVLLYDCEQVPVVSVNMLSGLNMLSISFYSLSSLYLFSNKYKRWLGASCDWLFILLLKVPFWRVEYALDLDVENPSVHNA